MKEVYFVAIEEDAALEDFRDRVKLYFSKELVKSEVYPSLQEAKIYTEKLFLEKFLSEGRFITGHHVASIKERHTDNVVGTLWYTENFINRNQETVARICYLEIQEAMRHQGYGAAALHHVIQQLLAVKIKKLTLNVFADNHFAIHLYEKNGFSIVWTDGKMCEMER